MTNWSELTRGVAIAATAAFLATSAGAQNWSFFGPQNCNTNSPGYKCAGRTLAICTDPDDESIVYAGHASGGVWRSDDDGDHWERVKDGPIGALLVRDDLPAATVHCLAGPSGTGNLLIVGTGEWTGYPTFLPGDGIWISTTGAPGSFTHPLAWSIRDNRSVTSLATNSCRDLVYAGTNQGLYRSSDGGYTWTQTPHSYFGESEITDVKTHPLTPNIAVVTTAYPDPATSIESGAYRTTDGGDTWTLVSFWPAWPGTNVQRANLAWSSTSPFSLYARVIYPSDNPARIVRSTDGGATWTAVWTWGDCGVPGDDALCDAKGAVTRNAFAIAQGYDDYLVTGAVSLYRSWGTGGSEWKVRSSGPFHFDVHDVYPTSTGFWIATDGGIFFDVYDSSPSSLFSTDYEKNDDYRTLQFYDIGLDPDAGELDLVGGGTQDNGSWINRPDSVSGGDWVLMGFGDGWWTTASDEPPGALTGTDVFYYWMNTSLFVTDNAYANNQSSDRVEIQFPGSGSSEPGDIFYDPSAPEQVFFFHGDTLAVVESDLSATDVYELGVPCNGIVNAGAVVVGDSTAANPTRVYVVTRHGKVQRINLDTASHADLLPSGASSPPWFAQNVAVSDLVLFEGATMAEDEVWVTVGRVMSDFLGGCGSTPATPWSRAYDASLGGHVWRWKDGAWTERSGTGRAVLPKEPFETIVSDPLDSSTFYAGTLHTVYRTTNAGLTWFDVGVDLPDVFVHDLVFEPGSRTLYAGTHGLGIWQAFVDNWGSLASSPTTPSSLIAPQRDLPEAKLVRRSDRVELSLAGPARIDVAVYDVTGRLVRDVLHRPMLAGEHDLDVRQEEMASGVYFMRLLVDGVQQPGLKLLVRR
ncbi:MAG: hypothetical protein KC591_15090 [Gemmatimonadetes bacterium]|nr:hypothetical protein [Gemmatimonadota bacterium]